MLATFHALRSLLKPYALAIVPTMYAERMAQSQPVRIWELPVQGPGYAVNLLWHASTDFDSEQLYVRDKVRQLFARP